MKTDAPPVVILAHGQPSDPARAAAELAGFAACVAGHLPDRRVMAATLAQAGALAEAVAGAGPQAEVFPLFMAGGWFTRILIPKRLAEAGAVGWRVLEPFGCDPALHDLAATIVAETLPNPDAQVLLAAHGSSKSPAPAHIAHRVAEVIRARTGLCRVEAAFIEQSPTLASVQGYDETSLCLPFFAAAGGHVSDDIPAALSRAGFRGKILPPLGLDPRAPGLVAAAIRRGQPICATGCRHG
jgi:sirohydrochlorin ferrochelatase